MIGTELYIEKIKKSKINKNSPLELITELDIIKKFETDTGKLVGVVTNEPFYDFRLDVFRNRATGKLFRYTNVEYPKNGNGAASLIVIHNTDGEEYLLLLKSFRIFIDEGSWVYEICRGFADPCDKKSSMNTSMRELFEETGIDITKVQHTTRSLGAIYPDSGLSNNEVDLYRIDLFVNTSLKLNNLDENEHICDYKLVNVKEIKKLVSEIKDSFTLCAIAKAFI